MSGIIDRSALEALAEESSHGTLVILDVGNVRVGPDLPDVLAVLSERVLERVRESDVVGHLGADLLGVFVTGGTADELDELCTRLRGVFDEPCPLPDARLKQLHGTVTSVPAGPDVLVRALLANAAAVDEEYRRIFIEGIWGAPGLREAQTLEHIAFIGDVCAAMMGMTAYELTVHGRSFVRPLGAVPEGEPAGVVPVRAGGDQVGTCRWWFPQGAVVPTHPQYFSAMSAAVSETVERVLQTERLAHAASRDPLTGLLNRRGLAGAMEEITEPYSVVLIDVDDFKEVNSRLGLAGGDEVLKAVAALLDDARGGDVVARWGGEEFLVVLPAEPVSAAAARAERLLARSIAEIVAGERAVAFSCGVAGGAAGELVDAVVARADTALVAAKAAGKARVEVNDRG